MCAQWQILSLYLNAYMKPEQQLTVNIKLWLLPSTHPGELSNNGDGLLVQLNSMLF